MAKKVPYTPLFATIKIIDIGLTTTYYFLLGLLLAKWFDHLYDKFDPEAYKKVSTLRIFLEIVVHLFILGIVAYAMRNIIELIPYPLDGVAGFEHKRLKELGGGVTLGTVLLLFQKNLRDKISFFTKRIGVD